MPMIITCNQKGGVAKTTTVLGVALSLTEMGYKVLVLDFDPQCTATATLGPDVRYGRDIPSLYHVLHKKMHLRDVIQKTPFCDIAPASHMMYNWKIPEGITKEEYIEHQADEEWLLKTLHHRFSEYGHQELMDEYMGILSSEIDTVIPEYDYILVDTNPNLNDLMMLTMYAAAKHGYCIIPAFPEESSRKSIVGLYETILGMNIGMANQLKIAGILITQDTKRTNLSKRYERYLRHLAKKMGTVVFETKIRQSISAREYMEHGTPLLDYDPKGATSEDYRAFTRELIERIGKMEKGYGEKTNC